MRRPEYLPSQTSEAEPGPQARATHLEDGAHAVLTISWRLLASVGCSPTEGAWNRRVPVNSKMHTQCAEDPNTNTWEPRIVHARAHDLGTGTGVGWGRVWAASHGGARCH